MHLRPLAAHREFTMAMLVLLAAILPAALAQIVVPPTLALPPQGTIYRDVKDPTPGVSGCIRQILAMYA
jgi:hypothetical protein